MSGSVLTRVLYSVIVSCVLVSGVLAMVIAHPEETDAAGNMADLQCLPVWFYGFPCGMPYPPPPQQPYTIGGQGCPCVDVTNGFSTPGTCVAANVCKASAPAGMPMLPMLPMPMPMMPMPMMPMPPQDPCFSGVGGFGPGSNATTSTSTRSGGCPNYSVPEYNFPSFDTSSIFNTSGSESTAGNDLISSLLNGTQSSSGGGTGSQGGGSIVPGSNTPTATGTQPRHFGTAEGVSGDIQLRGTAATLMVSNRDSARGTQVSGLYGFSLGQGITADTLFKMMCGMRPWSSGFISFIIPSNYFDSLCTARGYALSVRITPPPPTPPAPPSATPRPPPPPPPPAYLGPLRAEIWASPQTVAPGGRTSIFWTASGVSSCSITSSDGAFSGSSVSGHSSSQILTRNTTFTIQCMSATSTISNQVVVPVQ